MCPLSLLRLGECVGYLSCVREAKAKVSGGRVFAVPRLPSFQSAQFSAPIKIATMLRAIALAGVASAALSVVAGTPVNLEAATTEPAAKV